ncbi:enhanced serine sensitivity protein SseB C-terminal domain-containing protein [Streptococcus fryi]
MSDLKSLYNIYVETKEDSDWINFSIMLSESHILVPFYMEDSEMLFTIRDTENNEYFPIFSDFQSFEGHDIFFEKNLKIAEVTLDYIYELLENSISVGQVVLDPYDINIVMNKEDIKSLISQRDSRRIVYGIPAEDTTTLEKGLSIIFKGIPRVNAVFLTKVVIQEKSSYLLVIDHHEHNEESLFKNISHEILTQGIESAMPVDLISSSAELGKEIVKNISPFYSSFDQ